MLLFRYVIIEVGKQSGSSLANSVGKWMITIKFCIRKHEYPRVAGCGRPTRRKGQENDLEDLELVILSKELGVDGGQIVLGADGIFSSVDARILHGPQKILERVLLGWIGRVDLIAT